MNFGSHPRNFEINGSTFTNIAGNNYNTKHLIAQQRDVARVPDSLINTIDVAASSGRRTQATQLTESNPINAEGAAVNNIARDNYNVKNLSLNYTDSGTSSELNTLEGPPTKISDMYIIKALKAFSDVTSPSAAFNSRDRYPPPKCHPGTRQAILDQITAWGDKGPGVSEAERMLWVHGPAGAGKSAVAQTIAENCDHRELLAASFFFSRAHVARNSIDRLFITIAYQLAVSIPPLRPEVLASFSNDPTIVNQTISAQVDKLIIAPFQILAASQAQSSQPSPFIVIIDGLDECAGKDNQSEVLDQVLRLIKIPGITLCFLIVSRPEYTIKDTLEQHEFSLVSSTPVDLYGDLRALEDVRDYLNHEFARIRNSPKHRLWMSRLRGTPWPTESEVDCLVKKSGGYFIYAVTLVKFVDQEVTSPIKHLALILSTESLQNSPFEELDRLYHHIFTEVINILVDHIQITAVHNLKRKLSHFLHQDTYLHQQQPSTVLQGVLRAVAGEVPDDFIPELYGLDNDQVLLTFRGLQSIMLSSDGYGGPKDTPKFVEVGLDNSVHHPAHATVYDFLVDPARAGHFHISPVSESFWADQFWLMLDYMHRYNQYTETMDWSQPPREPSLKTVTYIYSSILSFWSKAGPSDQSTLLKAMQTKSHNFWFPLPPSAPALPWGDVKLEPLGVACLSSVWMLTKAALEEECASLAPYFNQVCGTVLKPLFSPPQHLAESERIISAYLANFRMYNLSPGTMSILLGLQHPLQPSIQKLLNILLSNKGRGIYTTIGYYLENTLVSLRVASLRMVTWCLELVATADMDDTLADVRKAHSFARVKWGSFLDNTLRGDKKLLLRLESLPRNIILGSEYFSSQLNEIEEIERAGGHTLPRSRCWICNNGVAIEERYHGSMLEKIMPHQSCGFDLSLVKKCNARALFLQHDTYNAMCVINWLKRHDPPPQDLLAKWEAYHTDLCAAQKCITEVVLVEDLSVMGDGTEELRLFNPIGAPFAPFETQEEWSKDQGEHMKSLHNMGIP
ncbi:hypothetical protein DXG01_001036 [Tephrocybe rancida]|nr:hypothetical protein DXG01_001036 [Tephrocybe rancida]